MKKLFSLLIVSATLVFSVSAQQTATVRKAQFNLERSGLAIQGYDPVAYFSNTAIEGKEDITATHNGVTYYFATAKNRETFKADPGKYEPQYGGWCAYAMGASGKKVEVDPETFKIADGKLYLFYNRFLNNTLTDWNKDEARLKAVADKNWTKFMK